MIKRRGNTKLVIVGIAGAVSLAIFSFLQMTTTTVYQATTAISSGTEITQDLLSTGTIVAKSVPKSLVNSATIKDFSDIEGKFVKFPIGPDQLIYSYDMAGESDVKNNSILRSQNLEALTLNADEMLGGVEAIANNDRVNLYAISKIDLSKFTQADMTTLGELPETIKKMFMSALDKDESYEIAVGEYQISKLIGQNIPVVEVSKEQESNKVVSFTVGVNHTLSEEIYLSMSTGHLGVNILPYNENSYKVKEEVGSVENIQYLGKSEVVKDK